MEFYVKTVTCPRTKKSVGAYLVTIGDSRIFATMDLKSTNPIAAELEATANVFFRIFKPVSYFGPITLHTTCGHLIGISERKYSSRHTTATYYNYIKKRVLKNNIRVHKIESLRPPLNSTEQVILHLDIEARKRLKDLIKTSR